MEEVFNHFGHDFFYRKNGEISNGIPGGFGKGIHAKMSEAVNEKFKRSWKTV